MECVGQMVSHRNLYLWKCGFQKNQGPSEPKNLVMVKVVRSKVLYGVRGAKGVAQKLVFVEVWLSKKPRPK